MSIHTSNQDLVKPAQLMISLTGDHESENHLQTEFTAMLALLSGIFPPSQGRNKNATIDKGTIITLITNIKWLLENNFIKNSSHSYYTFRTITLRAILQELLDYLERIHSKYNNNQWSIPLLEIEAEVGAIAEIHDAIRNNVVRWSRTIESGRRNTINGSEKQLPGDILKLLQTTQEHVKLLKEQELINETLGLSVKQLSDCSSALRDLLEIDAISTEERGAQLKEVVRQTRALAKVIQEGLKNGTTSSNDFKHPGTELEDVISQVIGQHSTEDTRTEIH